MQAPFLDIDLPLADRRDGKVRVSYAYGASERMFITTDRLSAFDRVIAGVPFKGQVLNQLSAWWFERTDDVVANHVLALPDPNVLIARTAQPLSVEVIGRMLRGEMPIEIAAGTSWSIFWSPGWWGPRFWRSCI